MAEEIPNAFLIVFHCITFKEFLKDRTCNKPLKLSILKETGTIDASRRLKPMPIEVKSWTEYAVVDVRLSQTVHVLRAS